MNTPLSEPEFIEPERYELREGVHYRFQVNRREFVQVLAAGLVVSTAVGNAVAQRRGRDRGARLLSERLHLGADGNVTVLTGKVEVGQGSRTQLTQAAAEELRLPVDRVRLIMADSDRVPDDGGTAGSRTTPSTVPSVRKACAVARDLLLKTAASIHNVDREKLSVRNGKVEGLPADGAFSYADLAAEKYAESLRQRITPGIELTQVSEWRVLGTSAPRVGGIGIVTGAHRYPSDIIRPDMLYGKVLRQPAYGAELKQIDLTEAKALPNVTAVRDGDFIGFTAPTSFEAERARSEAAKTAEWEVPDHPSSDKLFDHLRSQASSERSRRDRKGSPEEAFQSAKTPLRQTYHVAYVQHAPMEPRAAVAEWNDNQLTVWTGTQQPSRVHEELSRTFHIPRERVRVIVPDTGGGFGGKHTGEVAVEAARLAKAARRPVSLRWTREEEFTWAYFRPAGVIDVAAAMDDSGNLTAWRHININSGSSAIETPYQIPNVHTEFQYCDSPLREGSYRALASTANAFARESFMDELAAEAGMDPLEFRLRHLSEGRLRSVLVAAAERFNWKAKWKKPTSRKSTGVGLACGTEKGSYVACCARIEVDHDSGEYKVVNVCEAFECGAIQNPGNLRAQVDGCILQGMGPLLHEEIRFEDGRITNPRFSQYNVPRFKDVPEIETVLVERPDLPSVGAGETPIIGIAPAVSNALFNATQSRIRSLPLRNSRLKAKA